MSKLYALILVIAVSWLIILEIERRGKLGAERHIIFLLFKTEKGKAFISKIAMHRRFWKVFASVGIAVGILGMFAVVYLIAFTVYSKYVLELPTPSGVMAVIPGVTIPFWYGMFGLMTVLVVHEFSHGIVARSENVSLKSLGIVFLTIIPIGAFVEPDEKELKSKSRIARLRVYAVGSFGNILLALVGALIIFSFLGFFYDLSTVQVSGIVDGAPAEEVLEEGMILKSIDGKDISSNQDFSKI
ncbi:MAG: site-2 protease family protein, partial [Candidatus Hydrothermarchaeaceae archaeon]